MFKNLILHLLPVKLSYRMSYRMYFQEYTCIYYRMIDWSVRSSVFIPAQNINPPLRLLKLGLFRVLSIWWFWRSSASNRSLWSCHSVLLHLWCSSAQLFLDLLCLTRSEHKLEAYLYINYSDEVNLLQFALTCFFLYPKGKIMISHIVARRRSWPDFLWTSPLV